jgi:hypothetical protein
MPTAEEGWRVLLARLEADFADVKVPAVHSRDDQSPGLLLLLEQSIAGEHYDLAARIIEDLRNNKSRWVGQLASAKARRHPKWHLLAKPIWLELRDRYNELDCSRTIKKRLRNVDGVRDVRQIRRAIEQWEGEEHAAKKV